MNYDFMYSFNNDPNAIQFSQGKLSHLKLDELNLDETLAAPISDLRYLSAWPYLYELRERGAASTDVDFNRNGVFGESAVRADINNGTAVTAQGRLDFEKSAGGLTLAAFSGRLIAVFAEELNTEGSEVITGPSLENPVRLRYQTYSKSSGLSNGSLLSPGYVTGDPSAIASTDRLLVAFPKSGGYGVASYKFTTAGQTALVEVGSVYGSDMDSPQTLLVRTTDPEKIYLFLWSSTNNRILYREVVLRPELDGISLGPQNELRWSGSPLTGPIYSNGPIGGAFNEKTGELALVTTSRSGSVNGRMKFITLERDGDAWTGRTERWVNGTEAEAPATTVEPSVVFDGRRTAGPHGRYLIYSVAEAAGTDKWLMELTQLNTRADGSNAWTRRLMMNIWTVIRGGMSAVLFEEDIAWGWRKYVDVPSERPGSLHNTLHIYLLGSGIADKGITDFDDVGWLAQQGLRSSVQHSIWRHSGGTCVNAECPSWERLDANPNTKSIAVRQNFAYQLHFNGNIFLSTGSPCDGDQCPGWTQIGSSPDTQEIVASTGGLYQLRRRGKIFRFTGIRCSAISGCPGWEMLESNPSVTVIAAGGSSLFQLRRNGQILEYTGKPCGGPIMACTGWRLIDNNPSTTHIIAGRTGELYQRHRDGSIWRYTGRGCRSGTCLGWQLLDNNPSSVEVATGGGRLYQRHRDGSIWQFNGTPCSGSRCRGWAQIDNNSKSQGITVGDNGVLFQIQNDGSIWRHKGTACIGSTCLGWEQLDNNERTTSIDAGGHLYQLHGAP